MAPEPSVDSLWPTVSPPYRPRRFLPDFHNRGVLLVRQFQGVGTLRCRKCRRPLETDPLPLLHKIGDGAKGSRPPATSLLRLSRICDTSKFKVYEFACIACSAADFRTQAATRVGILVAEPLPQSLNCVNSRRALTSDRRTRGITPYGRRSRQASRLEQPRGIRSQQN